MTTDSLSRQSATESKTHIMWLKKVRSHRPISMVKLVRMRPSGVTSKKRLTGALKTDLSVDL